jgi:hypothetical protein
LAQVRQKRGETVAEYIHRFREVKNRCYSTRIIEKEAVELESLGLAKSIKDMGLQLEFNSLVHLVDTEDAEDFAEEQEVAVAEWT